jgi:tetratricopeptide (TPR) repeat protein
MEQQITVADAIEQGLKFHRAGKLDEAERTYRTILAHIPNHPDAIHLLGVLAGQRGRNDIAIQLIKQAIALKPLTAEFHFNLSGIYRAAGNRDEAIAQLKRTIEIRPDMPGAYAILGLVQSEVGLLDEGMQTLQKSLEYEPNRAGTYLDIGNIHWKKGKHEEALAAFKRAVDCDPTDPSLHWSVARVLLQLGRLKEGWEHFEWRIKYKEMKLDRGFAEPQWDGSNATGRTVLLHTEGGLGDAVNFIRLVPPATRRGGKFILECQPTLVSLFEGTEGIDQIIPRGQRLPPFDFHMPLQGLPRILGITLENIPNQVPYLHAPKDRATAFAAKIPRDDKLRVGLVWCGVMYNEEDFRTRTLEAFYPLLKQPGVRFFSLQKGEAASQKPPAGVDWVDFSADLKEFADTAALVENLDLVISVDTSTAHLAGALAKPVFVLIPTQSDFRWLLDRTDSPWYPTMRLFRQPLGEDWSKPLAELTTALAEFVRAR